MFNIPKILNVLMKNIVLVDANKQKTLNAKLFPFQVTGNTIENVTNLCTVYGNK